MSVTAGRFQSTYRSLTDNGQSNHQADAQDHEDHVKDEVLVVIHSNTVVHPRTMTALMLASTSLKCTLQQLTDPPSPHIARTSYSAYFSTPFESSMLYRNEPH